MPTDRAAFTLIELLIVVTIIAVLLALLTPALDKAIYQAGLVRCGANLHTVGSGTAIYTMDFKRRYPYRAGVWDRRTGLQPRQLTTRHAEDLQNVYDDRPTISGHLPLNALVCPLAPKISVRPEDSDPDTFVAANYSLWFGFGYVRPGGARPDGMFKIGDRWGWENNEGPFKFDILGADSAILYAGSTHTAHPDLQGNGSELRWQNEQADRRVPSQAPGLAAGTLKVTFSEWRQPVRGPGVAPVDLNYLTADGASLRVSNLNPDLYQDDRVTGVPWQNVSGESEITAVLAPKR